MKSGSNLMTLLSLAWMLFLFAGHAYGKNEKAAELFALGNKYYMDQDYEMAAETYEKLLSQDVVAADIYYNLGNAYYKSGEIAKAILNYERARRLRPSDADITYNLRMANLHTIDKIEPVPKVFYEKWWEDFVNEGSVSDRAKWVAACFWIALVLAGIYLFSQRVIIRKVMFFTSLGMLFTALFLWYLTHSQHRSLNNRKAALIFTESAYVKSSPDESSANLFMLHSGTRIDVIDELSGWKRIRIANGNEGWVNAESIAFI